MRWIAVVLLALLVLSGCAKEEKGTFEKAGAAVDEAVEDTQQAAEEAKDEAEKKAEELKQEAEETLDDATGDSED